VLSCAAHNDLGTVLYTLGTAPTLAVYCRTLLTVLWEVVRIMSCDTSNHLTLMFCRLLKKTMYHHVLVDQCMMQTEIEGVAF
jgi:hypothetical protein